MKKIFITGGSGFIGTNLIESLIKRKISVLNFDWNPPLNPEHKEWWKDGDIMDYQALNEAVAEFQPDCLVHLAARTDTDIYDLEADLNEYIVNTQGTRNVLNVIKENPEIKRAIITSTQFVCEAGYIPKHDEDYMPFTLYGKSKMIAEQDTRKANLNCTWTLIRPSTIWGPWALRYRDVMFKVMRKGIYFHPSKKNVFRSYGYVKNVVHQIEQILQREEKLVHEQVFYVGDEPLNLLDWVKSISKELTGKKVRIIPTWIVKCIALCGDVLLKFGIGFPITSTRFNSMTKDYITPIDKTINAFGEGPYSMDEGVKEMIKWYFDKSMSIEKPILKMPKESYIEEMKTRESMSVHG